MTLLNYNFSTSLQLKRPFYCFCHLTLFSAKIYGKFLKLTAFLASVLVLGCYMRSYYEEAIKIKLHG